MSLYRLSLSLLIAAVLMLAVGYHHAHEQESIWHDRASNLQRNAERTQIELAALQATARKKIAVLDFGVLAEARSSAILGHNVTLAVAAEMSSTGKYDPISSNWINQQFEEWRIAQPLNNNGL